MTDDDVGGTTRGSVCVVAVADDYMIGRISRPRAGLRARWWAQQHLIINWIIDDDDSDVSQECLRRAVGLVVLWCQLPTCSKLSFTFVVFILLLGNVARRRSYPKAGVCAPGQKKDARARML